MVRAWLASAPLGPPIAAAAERAHSRSGAGALGRCRVCTGAAGKRRFLRPVGEMKREREIVRDFGGRCLGAALLPGSGSGTDEIRHLDFEEWGAVFRDKVMAAALVDRLLHRCRIVNIRGQQLPHAGAPGNVGLLAAVRGLTIDPLSAMEMAENDERSGTRRSLFPQCAFLDWN